MLPGKEIFLLFIGSFLLHLTKAANTNQMYALCPPDFFGIGTECYYISQKKVNWLDAHFDCKDRKSRLAEPNRYEDRMIRKFLVNNDLTKASKWIGGNYNWAKKKWQWQDGKEFIYQSFSQTPGGVQELQYHCAVLNPDLKYRWSAISCVEKHQYICQHRMPYVNEKHRSRIYTRWNQTYPNEQATQVEVTLNDADILKRGHRQSIPVNGRLTNTQRLSRHRNYLASEWLKKYRSQQIVINRNAIPNEISLIDTQERKVQQRPNRLTPRRRNPLPHTIGREDFIKFEKKKNVNRGPLITNKVDDFDKQDSYTTRAPSTTTDGYSEERTRQPSRVEVVATPPSYKKVDSEFDLKEKKRLEDTKRWLETGRYEHAYTRRRIPTTTTATATTESSAGTDLEGNRDHDQRRQQEEEDQERRRDEETRRYEVSRRDELRRREEERQRMEEKRIAEHRQEEERRIEEERMQNQINEETLRFEHEEQLRRSRIEQEEQRRAEEKKRIQDQHARDREEKMRLRELELKEREEEEQRIREDEERRQNENRQRLEEVERQQREEEERRRQEAENKRIEEENRRRRKEEQRNKQKMRQNQTDQGIEEEVSDLRLKEKLRKEKIARLRERIKNLSPELQLKFYELRGERYKKHNDGTENETATNQL